MNSKYKNLLLSVSIIFNFFFLIVIGMYQKQVSSLIHSTEELHSLNDKCDEAFEVQLDSIEHLNARIEILSNATIKE